MEKWAPPYKLSLSIILSIGILVLLIFLTNIEGYYWVYAPLVFPTFFAFMFWYLGVKTSSWFFLPIYCLTIVLFYTYVMDNVGQHDDMGAALLHLAYIITFSLTFIIVAAAIMYIRRSKMVEPPKWAFTLSWLIMALAPIILSYLVLNHLNFNN